MLKIFHPRLEPYVNRELPDDQAGFRKGRGIRDRCQHPLDHQKHESSRKTSTLALFTMPKPLTVWITTNCGKLREMGIPDHLICLLRNLYAGQEATVKIGYGTTNWFQTGKGVCQAVYCRPAYLIYTQSTS